MEKAASLSDKFKSEFSAAVKAQEINQPFKRDKDGKETKERIPVSGEFKAKTALAIVDNNIHAVRDSLVAELLK